MSVPPVSGISSADPICTERAREAVRDPSPERQDPSNRAVTLAYPLMASAIFTRPPVRRIELL
ncbi:hypothetical protein GCM10027033_01200 [Leucobacter ruminantium]